MWVVDASAVAEILLGTERGHAAAALLEGRTLVAPPHLAAEVTSVVRGWSLGGHITDEQALRALREFDELGIDSVEMNALLPDAWALRHNLTAYDALYVVLARRLGCPLLTLDTRMAAAAPDCTALP